MKRFWEEREKWASEVFGTKKERGPEGPLTHLLKEVEKELLPNPYDLEEYADTIFLIFDAAYRAGFTYDELHGACWYKLAKNKKRKWGKPDEKGVIEHVRGTE